MIHTLTDERITKVYKNSNFNKSATARALGISSSYLYKLIETREDLTTMMYDAQEERLDNAEEALAKLVDLDNFQAIKFTLETKGRRRGYGKSIELTGSTEKPLALITSEMTPEEASRAYMDTIKPNVDDL